MIEKGSRSLDKVRLVLLLTKNGLLPSLLDEEDGVDEVDDAVSVMRTQSSEFISMGLTVTV